MRVCFLCSTPYQIFSAINLKNYIFANDAVDIFVFDYFKNSDIVTERLNKKAYFLKAESCHFKEIHSLLTSGNKLEKVYQKLRFHHWEKDSILRFFGSTIYDTVFFSNQDPVNSIIISELYKKNDSLSVRHFEDGWVDYAFPDGFFFNKRTEISNSFWKTPKEFFTRQNSYMYRPELSEAWKTNQSIQKIEIDNNKTLAYTNQVFGYTRDAYINEKVLYFDTLAENKLGISTKEHLCILDFCCNFFSKRDIIIKKHPRNFSKDYEVKGYEVYKYQSIPFEVICSNQNFENCLLISSFSTACFSPNILFEQEPFIILTYKLTGHEAEMDNKTLSYLNQIKNNYSRPERIFIPETYDQLTKGIELFKRYLKNEND